MALEDELVQRAAVLLRRARLALWSFRIEWGVPPIVRAASAALVYVGRTQRRVGVVVLLGQVEIDSLPAFDCRHGYALRYSTGPRYAVQIPRPNSTPSFCTS